LKRLIGRPADGLPHVTAKKQSANGTMRDYCDITIAVVRQNSVDCLPDSPLRINSPLPATNALLGLCEEGVRDLLELCRRQEAGCDPVILAKVTVHRDADAEPGSQDSRRFDGLGLRAGPYGRHSGNDRTLSELPHARQPGITQSPALNRDKRIDYYLWMRDEEQIGHAVHNCMGTGIPPTRARYSAVFRLFPGSVSVRIGVARREVTLMPVHVQIN
jgi:hypothetical protein